MAVESCELHYTSLSHVILKQQVFCIEFKNDLLPHSLARLD